MKKILSLISMFAVAVTIASAKTKSVRIFLVPWDTDFRVAASADTVRKIATIKTDITDSWYADAFIAWLGADRMKMDAELKVADVRLVVDAEQEDGTMHSYYASCFAICDASTGKVRAIDAAFRSRFSYFYEK